jgi:hypothetical protein
MVAQLPEDRSLVEVQTGAILPPWHQFLKLLADAQDDEIAGTVAEQAETITSLTDELAGLKESLNGLKVIEREIMVQSTATSATVTHTFTHNLGTEEPEVDLFFTSGRNVIQSYPLSPTQWRVVLQSSINGPFFKARFRTIKTLSL